MSSYFFCIRNGLYSGTSDCVIELADRDAAWAEMTKVCGDLVGGIARHLKRDAQWQMELLDNAKRPVFRISLVSETLVNEPAAAAVKR